MLARSFQTISNERALSGIRRGPLGRLALALILSLLPNACKDADTVVGPTPVVGTLRLNGVVRSWEGQVIAGAGLTILDGPQRGTHALSDQSGGYVFEGLSAGTIGVRVFRLGFFTLEKSVHLVSDTEFDFELSSP